MSDILLAFLLPNIIALYFGIVLLVALSITKIVKDIKAKKAKKESEAVNNEKE